MPRYPQPHTDGAAVALAIHLGIYCALAGGFAGGFYQLMQPRRIENVGLAAYKPLPGTVLNYAAAARRHDQPMTVTAAVEPEPAAIGATAEQAPEATKSSAEAKEERPKRQRTARPKEHRDYMADYAYQPTFGGYRPWY
jgi:hypothetical protein